MINNIKNAEDLGSIIDVNMDVPYYSMTFNFIFYSKVNNSNLNIFLFKFYNISSSKITLENQNVVFGHIYIYFGNLQATDYAITYLKDNLFLI